MNGKGRIGLGGLILLALFIWFYTPYWKMHPDDTLPILVSFPLFFWLGSPWEWKQHPTPLPSFWLGLGGGLFLIGSLCATLFLLSVGWCCLFWSWINAHVAKRHHSKITKLMLLPLMAFPWIAVDGELIGWYFRLTGAKVTEIFFALTPVEVIREGTLITVNGIGISVEAPCSGLNILQTLLITGSVLCFSFLDTHPLYWFNLASLPLIAWLANTLRIITICIAAITVSPEFARGPVHDIGGWIILLLMFGLCWGLFSRQAALLHQSPLNQ